MPNIRISAARLVPSLAVAVAVVSVSAAVLAQSVSVTATAQYAARLRVDAAPLPLTALPGQVVTVDDAVVLNFTAGALLADATTSTDTLDSFTIGQVSTDVVVGTDAINQFTVAQVLSDQATLGDATALTVSRPNLVDAVTATDAVDWQVGLPQVDSVSVGVSIPVFSITVMSADGVAVVDGAVVVLTMGAADGRVNAHMVNALSINDGA